MTYITFLHAHHVHFNTVVSVGKRAAINVNRDQYHVVGRSYLDAVSCPVAAFQAVRISLHPSPFSFIVTNILSASSASSQELGMPRGAIISFLGAWRLRGVLWTVMPSTSPFPLAEEADLSVLSVGPSIALISFSVLTAFALVAARFPFLGVTGSRPSVSPSVSCSTVLASASATPLPFGEARFLVAVIEFLVVIESAPAPVVVEVAFFAKERFLAGWEDSSLAAVPAPRFLGVFGTALVSSVTVSWVSLVH